MEKLIFPDFKLLPEYDLSKVISPRKLFKLKKTRVYLSTEEESEKTKGNIDNVPPTSFLRQFESWLNYLKEFFEKIYDLNLNFDKNRLDEASNIFNEFQQNFVESSWLSKALKKYVEDKTQLICYLGRLLPSEIVIALTMSKPSALELKLIHESQAKFGNTKSKNFLSKVFFSGLNYKPSGQLSLGEIKQIKENLKQTSDEKNRLMMLYPRLEPLDKLLCLDNCEEMIFWKIGSHRYLMYGLYYKLAKVLDKEIKGPPSILDYTINLDILYEKLRNFGDKNEN